MSICIWFSMCGLLVIYLKKYKFSRHLEIDGLYMHIGLEEKEWMITKILRINYKTNVTRILRSYWYPTDLNLFFFFGCMDYRLVEPKVNRFDHRNRIKKWSLRVDTPLAPNSPKSIFFYRIFLVIPLASCFAPSRNKMQKHTDHIYSLLLLVYFSCFFMVNYLFPLIGQRCPSQLTRILTNLRPLQSGQRQAIHAGIRGFTRNYFLVTWPQELNPNQLCEEQTHQSTGLTLGA